MTVDSEVMDLVVKDGQSVAIYQKGEDTPKIYMGTVSEVKTGTSIYPGTVRIKGTYGNGTVKIVGSDGTVKQTLKISIDADKSGYQNEVSGITLAEGDKLVYYSDDNMYGSAMSSSFFFRIYYEGGSSSETGTGLTSTKTLTESTTVYGGLVNGTKTYFLTQEQAIAAGATDVKSMTAKDAVVNGYTPDSKTISNDGYSFETSTSTLIKTSTLATNTAVWVSEGASNYHAHADCDNLAEANAKGSLTKQVQLIDAVRYGINPCPLEYEYDGYSFTVPSVTTTTGGTTTTTTGGTTTGGQATTQTTQTKTLSLQSGQYTVGNTALVAGTYDLAVTSGSGTVTVTDKDGNVKYTLQVSQDGSNGVSTYAGLVLETGDVVKVSDGLTITLTTTVTTTNGTVQGTGTEAETMPQLGGGILAGVAAALGVGVAGGGAFLMYRANKKDKETK